MKLVMIPLVASRLRESGINGFNVGFDFSYFQPKGNKKNQNQH